MIKFGICLLAFGISETVMAVPRTTIVVNFGSRPTVEAAANSEAQVDWLDDEPSDDTACTDCFAATELRRCLRTMTGSADNFSIVDDDATRKGDLILVGGPDFNNLSRTWLGRFHLTRADIAAVGREGYFIKSIKADGRHVILIAGGSRVGTLYGAYDLLYRLGCRWFAPGESHEQLPHISKLGEWDLKGVPSFLDRGYYVWEDRGTPDFILWMARNRMNYWWVGQTGRPLLRKLGIRLLAGFHSDAITFLGPEKRYPYNHPRFEGDEGLPADPYPVSPQYEGDTNHDGKLSYFEAHPEWYYFDGKKRLAGMVRPCFGGNFCTSNPDAVTEFMKKFIHALSDEMYKGKLDKPGWEMTSGKYKGADMVRLMTLDGGKWCQCDACKALGSPTDRNLLLAERLNQEIQHAYKAGRLPRPVSVSFIAYAGTLEPPTPSLSERIAPSSTTDLTVTMYPINRCYVHYFDDPECDRNYPIFQKFPAWAPKPGRLFQGQLSVGEYYNISKFKSLPACYMHTMAHDIPLYYRLGVRHFEYMHVTTANWGSKALTNYQLARQLWDVNTDCKALWTDYFQRRYGPAAKIMRAFYESTEKMLCNLQELKYDMAPRLDKGLSPLFPNSHLRYRREPGVKCDGPTFLEIMGHSRECRRLLTKARRETTDSRIQALLAEDDLCFTYAEQTLAYCQACIEAYQLARADKLQEAKVSYEEATRLARVLRKDTHSATHASEDCNDVNALSASRAPRAVEHIAKLLQDKESATSQSNRK